MPVRYGYRSYGEGDDFDGLDPEELLALLSDDLMESGDLNEAMDRLLQDGFETPDGERVEGLRELLEQARRKRRELEQQADPDGELQRYRDWLEDIEQIEDKELDELLQEAKDSGDERRLDVTQDLVDQKNMQRDLMPENLAPRLNSYQNYEFVSGEARE